MIFIKIRIVFFIQMREDAPVYWSETWKAWVLTRYDDVMTVLRQPDKFSSAGRVSYLLKTLDEDVRNQLTHLERHYEIGVAHSDPPDHTRLRALLNKVFTPRMVETWRPRIETVTNELIDTMIDQPDPDIIRDIAYPPACNDYCRNDWCINGRYSAFPRLVSRY